MIPPVGAALTTSVADGIATIVFDVPGEPVNKFSRVVKDEFIALLDALERDPDVRAAVLLSGKENTFIAGADIEEFLAWTTPADATEASREGHRLLARLEDARVPLVAAMHGACLGGGLEMALACAYRIASDHPKTVLALPEVQLGLLPGGGGTQRLPRIVGLQAALDMILTGKNVRAKKAAQIGLVHELVHPAILRDIAQRRAQELAAGTLRRNPDARRRSASSMLLDDTPVGRAVAFRKARERTEERTKGHYPAPLAALEAVAAGYRGEAQGYETESRLFGELSVTPECRELIFLFFATTALKKDTGVGDSPVTPFPIERLGILGAGFMGSGIASVAVQHGLQVRLKDADLSRVGKGLAAVRDVLKERLTKKQITRQEYADQQLLASGTVDYSGFATTDCVIEAVFEDLAVKHTVLREVEQVVERDTIIASNTSTIPIARIASVARHPERLIGMHFFSPVHKMPLLEVIVTPATAPHVTAAAVAFGKRIGKTVIVVNDAPGFYVNRILTPYINEAGRLLDGGAAIDAIDRAMVAFGFPVGPITLLDEVGLDVAGKSGQVFYDAFGERMAPSVSLRRVIEAGRLGRKGKLGFYAYDSDGNKGDVDPTVYELLSSGSARTDFPDADIQQRCVLSMVNEATRCLEEGVVRSPRDADVGAVFGFGFPPFLGGPCRYVDSLGAEEVVTRLTALEGRYPGRFVPTALLESMARKRERFYPQRGRPV